MTPVPFSTPFEIFIDTALCLPACPPACLPADGVINETFSVPVQLIGNITAYSTEAHQWVPVINVSTSHRLQCYEGRGGCEPLTLYELDVIDYTRYSLNLTFNDSNLPELARDKNLTMAFVFSFMNPVSAYWNCCVLRAVTCSCALRAACCVLL